MTPDVSLRRFANACWWLLRALTHDEIIDALVNSARELSGADAVFFARREGDELRVSASSGLSNPDMARSWRLPVGEGVSGWVVAHRTSAIVRDYAHDPRRTTCVKSIVDAEGVRSAAVIPVSGLTEVIGALCLVHRSLLDPDQWPMEALELLVRQAVSLDVVVAFELERLAKKASDSSAIELQRVEGLPGLVARAVASEKGLSAGLQLVAERLGGKVVLIGSDGTILGRAEAVGAVLTGAELVPQAAVEVDAASRRLAQLRFFRRRPLRSRERHALSQCASVIALELLRERSALETEERLGRELFRELLSGTIADEESLRYRASLLGVSLTVPRAVLRVGEHADALKQEEEPAELREIDLWSLETNARNLGKAAVGWISESNVVLVVDVPGLSEGDLRQLAGKLLTAASSSSANRLAVGVGRLCTTITDYARASAEAQMALEIARARPLPNEIVTRSELGVCAFLVASNDSGELIGMVIGVLAPLLKADARSGSDYIHTLRVFHSCHRHVATAAERLHVHVNTLRHRLRKIEELLEVDLADADTRFMLELALRVHETLQPVGAV
jgi:DNA-binding PucR family transcriptional regulator